MPDPAAPAADVVTIEGVVERVSFASDDSAFSVVRVTLPGRREGATVVGPLAGVQPGETLRLRGRWTVDRRYGEQFQVASFIAVRPTTALGIERYLGSGLVPGIGPGLAERLVAKFGIETLDVIASQPERLTEVEGIGRVRSERIQRAWLEQHGIRDVMVFLQSFGIATGHATRIYRQYGERAIAVLRENPYRLAADVFGIGFKTADELAHKLGLADDSPARARAGVLHALSQAADAGHVGLPRDALIDAAVELLGVDRALVERAATDLATDGELVDEPSRTRRPFGARGPKPGGGAPTALPAGRSAEPSDDQVAGPLAFAERQPPARAVYLPALHAAECAVARRLGALLAARATPVAIDVERAIAWFEAQRNVTLAEAQRDAIRRAALRKVLVVTGGPGTGKTTIVNGILRILERKGLRIALAAPTGRAAKRLTETTGSEAKTIHRLLEWSPKTRAFERDESSPLDADLVVVDESSMLDVSLAEHLLAAVPEHARLVLVGDVDQLPSVGPGSVLADVIASDVVPVVRLSHIFRQAARSLIVENAHRVNEGRMPETAAGEEAGDFFFVEREEPEQVLVTIEKLLTERIPKRFGFDPVEDVQVLTPMNRGLLGAASLNQALQARLNPATGPSLVRGARALRAGDKVMQVRNDYELDVYNGDIGRVVAIDEEARAAEVRFDGRIVRYEQADLDALVLAYACSIHKSQGSEYPCVVVPLHTQHFVMLQRNLLYTAITRGKRLVVIVGNRRALEIAVGNARQEVRFSQLAARLREAVTGA